jgi:hypothetical protein
MPPRKKRNSSKVNLIISGVFHAVVIGALFFFAAREGILGQKLKKIAVTMAPKEKPPEKPKEKPPEPKNEPPKASAKLPEPKQMAVAPKPTAPPSAPAAAAPPAAAPPAAMVPAFDFGGGKIVESTTDPVAIYKNFVEYTLRARWARPENGRRELHGRSRVEHRPRGPRRTHGLGQRLRRPRVGRLRAKGPGGHDFNWPAAAEGVSRRIRGSL